MIVRFSAVLRVMLLLVVSLGSVVGPAHGQGGAAPVTGERSEPAPRSPGTPPSGGAPVATPNFWDQQQRVAQPTVANRARIRFLTSVDYPPFNFLDRRGRLAGFNVELARAICEELDVLDTCQIEARPFGELAGALENGDGEAVIAGLAVTPDNRQRFLFTDSYLRFPARFVVPRESGLEAALDAGLAGTTIGVVAGTGHEAMLRAFFPAAGVQTFESREALLDAVRTGAVPGAFADGVSLSFWLASTAAQDCCRFAGGPYFSDTFLGEGLAIAVRPGEAELADAFDYALSRLVQKGRFSELMLRYFPISAF